MKIYLKQKPQRNTLKVVTKFAYLPKVVRDKKANRDCLIWLENYKSLQKYRTVIKSTYGAWIEEEAWVGNPRNYLDPLG
jgi:hypothetical protein